MARYDYETARRAAGLWMDTLIQNAKDGIDHNREMARLAGTDHGKGKWSLIALRWHKRRRDYCRIKQAVAKEGFKAATAEATRLIAELQRVEASVKDKANRDEHRETAIELVENDLYQYRLIEQRLERMGRGVLFDDEVRHCV